MSVEVSPPAADEAADEADKESQTTGMWIIVLGATLRNTSVYLRKDRNYLQRGLRLLERERVRTRRRGVPAAAEWAEWAEGAEGAEWAEADTKSSWIDLD